MSMMIAAVDIVNDHEPTLAERAEHLGFTIGRDGGSADLAELFPGADPRELRRVAHDFAEALHRGRKRHAFAIGFESGESGTAYPIADPAEIREPYVDSFGAGWSVGHREWAGREEIMAGWDNDWHDSEVAECGMGGRS